MSDPEEKMTRYGLDDDIVGAIPFLFICTLRLENYKHCFLPGPPAQSGPRIRTLLPVSNPTA